MRASAAFRLKHYDLDVWKDAMRLVRRCYALTRSFRKDERFGLIGQIRRTAVSIPSNIAEGAARGSKADFARFLLISCAFLAELDTLLWLARTLDMSRILSRRVIRSRQCLSC